MTVSSLVRALRERWLVLVVGALVGLMVAAAVAWGTPRSYSAAASVYVAGIDAGPRSDAVSGALISPQRAASYRQLMTSDRVLEPAARRLGVAALPGRVSVVSAPNSAVFTVGVEAADPADAARVANAVGQRFTEVIAELEGPGNPGGLPSVVASVVDEARPSSVPVSPRVTTTLLVGLVAGAAVAVGAVLVGATLDTSVRTPGALRALVGGAALGVLPQRAPRRGSSDGGPFREAARQVRTRVYLAAGSSGARVLVFTGAREGEGTTTAVCALAETVTPEHRVLVVDADLRDPAVGDRLGLPAGEGLGDVLVHDVPVENVIRRHGEVDVLTAGTRPDDPAAVLSSPSFAAVLLTLRAQYEFIVIDTSPLLSAVDAVLVARHGDAAVVACREGRTSGAQLEEALSALEPVDTRLLGSVLTGARSRAHAGSRGERRSGPTGGSPGPHRRVPVPATGEGAVPLDRRSDHGA